MAKQYEKYEDIEDKVFELVGKDTYRTMLERLVKFEDIDNINWCKYELWIRGYREEI